jgi:hypothetical protein
MRRFIQISLLVIAILSFFGCNDTQLTRWTSARDEMKKDLVATTQRIAELEDQVSRLPEGPAKTEAQQALAKAQELVPLFRSKIDSLDNLIVAARAGDASNIGASVGGLLSGVPVVGPYAGLIGVLAGIGWGVFQRLARSRDLAAAQKQADDALVNLKNVVFSIEKAGPDWSEADKSAIAAIQGPSTSLAVEQIKRICRCSGFKQPRRSCIA